jgi:chromosome segregation ATPase
LYALFLLNYQVNRLKSELENHKVDIENLKAALTQAKNAAQTAASNFTEERDRYFESSPPLPSLPALVLSLLVLFSEAHAC